MKIFILILASVSVQSVLICNDGWTRHLNECYMFSTAKVSWASAKIICESFDSHLLAIDSTAEQDFIVNHLHRLHASGHFWTDGNDIQEENTYIFDHNKQPIALTFWASGQPDMYRNQPEDCITLNSPDFHWHDTLCGELNTFICEKESPDSKQGQTSSFIG